MTNAIYGLHNVIEGEGVPVSVTGMLIVFSSLALISLSIAALPGILKLVAGLLPEEGEGKAVAVDERVVAAIGYILQQRRKQK